jgi:excisionase family DNA binding protein
MQVAEKAGKARRAEESLSAASGRLLSVEAAAVYLGVSPWTIRDLLHAGTLARVRLPLGGERDLRRILVDRLELDALIERSKERGVA